MSCLPLSLKRQVMQQMLTPPIRTTDFWEYAVSTTWFTNWDQKSNQSKPSQSATHSLESWTSGSSVDNLPEESMEQHSRPMTMSDSDKENVYIPETHWKIFASWFGIDNKHYLRRRPQCNGYQPVAYEKGTSTYLCDRELDFLPVWVASLENMVCGQKQNIFHAFAYDTFDHIVKQVRRVLGVKRASKIRLWLSIQEEGKKIVLEPITEFSYSLVNKVAQFVPEIVKVLEARQFQTSKQGYRDDDVEVRGPLAEEWFGNRILSICLGIEEIGIDIHSPDTITDDFVAIDEETQDSIMTISSIRNEWDDILSTYVEEYTENVHGKTLTMKENLVTGAKRIVGEKLDELSDIRSDYEQRFRSLEKREEDVARKEKEIGGKERDLASRLALYKSGIDDFQKQKQKFEEDVKRIQEQNRIAESRVTLNIGGILYTTSIATLTKVGNSLLATMFSGSGAVTRDADGTFFIDRDGVNFRYILNYIRDGQGAIDALPAEPKLIKELLIEAKYYVLPEMEKMLQRKI